jgi:type VI secretion system secreted protein VgrG
MDTQVKNDESHSIDKNHTHFVGAKEEQRVIEDQTVGVKGHSTMLTEQTRTDNVVGALVIGSGTSIRLECGKSVLELTKDGDINITGINFNITVDQSGEINTSSGKLNLNPSSGQKKTDAPGDEHQKTIQSQIDSFFSQEEK